MKNQLSILFFALLFSLAGAAQEIDVRFTNFKYNAVSSTLDFEMEYKTGAGYVANSSSAGNLLGTNFYFNLWLESGFTFAQSITGNIIAPSNLNFTDLNPTYAGGLFQVSPDNNTFMFTLSRTHPCPNDIPSTWTLITEFSIPISITNPVLTPGITPTSATYLTIRDKTFATPSRRSTWSTTGATTGLYYNSQSPTYPLITCSSTATAANITVSNSSFCTTDPVSLTASLTVPGSITNPSYKWYASQTSTVVLASTATYAPSGAVNGDKFYVSVSGNDVCENAANDRKEVTVSIAVCPPSCPTTALWTGATDSDWNKASNWVTTSPVNAIPGSCTAVTIPGGRTNYPIITSSTNANCNTIHFNQGGEVKGTAFLTYTSASINLSVNTNSRWYMLAAPLRNMYSGDYILSTNRINPSVLMMRYQMDNPQYASVVKQSGKWSQTFNTLDVELNASSSTAFAAKINPGSAGAGPFTFNFPSTQTSYTYYNPDGSSTTQTTGTLNRTNSGRFIYEGVTGYNTTTGVFNFPIENGMESTYTNVIVGNPFMAHLDLTELYNANSSRLSGTFYIGDATLASTLETYMIQGGKVVTTAPSANSDSVTIAPMQSVFAARNGSTTFTTLSFTPAMTKIKPSIGIRSAQYSAFDGKLQLNISRDGERQSGAVVIYQKGASNGYVQSEDALSFFISNENNVPAVLYSAVDGKAVAINTVGDFSNDIELGVSTSVKGLLTIDFDGMESFGTDCKIELIDKLGWTQNLKENPSYTFNNETGNVEGRLFLRISNGPTANAFKDNTYSYFAKDGKLYVNSSEQLYKIEVINILGQSLYYNTNIGQANLEIPIGLANTFVILKVQTKDGIEVNKVLMK